MKFKNKIPIGDDGLIYTLPKMPDEKSIDGYSLPSKKQKFVRQVFLPEQEFEKLSKESKIEILTRELTRRAEGYWFFNNGLPTYLSPSHYFSLNYWYMAALTPDGMPDYRWAQTKWFYFIDYVEKDDLCFGGVMMSGKRFSKTEAGLAHIYNVATLGATRLIGDKMVSDTNCLFGMQSLSSTEAKNNLFKARVIRSHRKIPNYLKPKSNDSIGKGEITSELKFFGDKKGDNSTLALDNTIDHRPTQESAYQGKRPREVYWDEAGTIEEMDIEEALSTVKQQLQIGKRAFGKIFMPATLESMTPKGAPKFQTIWENSDPNERDGNGRTKSWLYRYFNPHYEGREDFIDEYGNSLVDEAKTFRANEIAIANAATARKIKRQYPETTAEAFDVVTGTYFEEDVMAIIKVRLEQVKEQERKGEIVESPYMILKTTDKHEAYPDKDGKIIILEHVRESVEYVLTIDGTSTDKNSGEDDGSFFASIMWKLFDPNGGSYSPVGFYYERPSTVKQAYMQSISMCHYWDKFKGFKKISAEGNASTASHLGTFLREQGLEKWILPRKDLSGKGNSNLDKDFQYIGIDGRDWQIKQHNLFLRKYVMNNCSKTILANYLKPADANADLRDSSLMLSIYLPINFDAPVKKKKPEVHKRKYLEMRNGVMTVVWREEKKSDPLLRKIV